MSVPTVTGGLWALSLLHSLGIQPLAGGAVWGMVCKGVGGFCLIASMCVVDVRMVSCESAEASGRGVR